MFRVLKHSLYGYVIRNYQTNMPGKKNNGHQRILKMFFLINKKEHRFEKPEISTVYLEQLWRVTYIITQAKNGAQPHVWGLRTNLSL